MRPGPDSLSWEGLQGTDSFFAWPVRGLWRALYGSARTETKPLGHWRVGPAEAPVLAGIERRAPRFVVGERVRLEGREALTH